MKYLLIITLLAMSCKLPKLGIESYQATRAIRTDGFYFNDPDFYYFMLFNDGVSMGHFSNYDKKVDSIKNSFLDSSGIEFYRKIPYAWGRYEIRKDSIFMANWQSREWAKYAVHKMAGVILDDSTLLLQYKHNKIDTFHFYYLPVKPDSTNKFTK